MEPTIFELRLKFKPRLKFFKFGLWVCEQGDNFYSRKEGGGMLRIHWAKKLEIIDQGRESCNPPLNKIYGSYILNIVNIFADVLNLVKARNNLGF